MNYIVWVKYVDDSAELKSRAIGKKQLVRFIRNRSYEFVMTSNSHDGRFACAEAAS